MLSESAEQPRRPFERELVSFGNVGTDPGTSRRIGTISRPIERDLRIDIVRGAALLIIHTDHFHDSVLASLTPRNFGFSDMAEIFIFLSGCVCGMTYGRVIQSKGFLACQKKALIRVGQLAISCAMTLIVLLVVQQWPGRNDDAVVQGQQSWMLRGNLVWSVTESVRNIEGASLLVGILSLYCMLLLALPLMLSLRRIHWSFLLIPSLLLYGFTQASWAVAVPFGYWREFTPFNPLAWQFLFSSGILLSRRLMSKPPSGTAGWLLPIVALIVVQGAFVAKAYFPSGGIPFIDKASLGPLRLLHFSALMILAYAVLPNRFSGSWKARPIRWISLCGQNSLIVFCSGTVLVVLLEGTFLAERYDLTSQIIANIAVWGGCVLIAALWQRAKQVDVGSVLRGAVTRVSVR